MSSAFPSPHLIELFGLYLARSGALVFSAPLLGGATSYAGVKITLSIALAMILQNAFGSEAVLPEGSLAYAVLIARELMIGIFLGFLLQLGVLAARVAGEMIGLEMAMHMSQQVDPESGVSTPLIARLYENLLLLALLAVDGHRWVLRALGASLERAPVGELTGTAGMGEYALAMLSEMFRAGMAFAAPVLVLLACVSATIGLLARAVPQLNILDLGFTLRIGVALVAMFVLAPMLEPAFETLLAAIYGWIDGAPAVLEG